MGEQLEEIAAKLQGSRNIEDIISVCKEQGKDISQKQVQEVLDLLNQPEDVLSLDDLDNVAGGYSRKCIASVQDIIDSLFDK